MKNFLRNIIRFIVEGCMRIYYITFHRMKVEGKKNIPKDGAVIFCSNHKSYLDPPLIKITARRKTYFLAKESLWNNKFLAFLGWVFEAIPVKRDEKDINAIKASLKYLKNGECIALFPEGTRNGMEKGQKAKDGAAFFTLRSGAKVVPIGISGDTKIFSKLTISYGKPLDFSEYDKNDKASLERITNEIMDNIIKLIK